MTRYEFKIEGPYDPEGKCPKCGHDVVGSGYHKACGDGACRRHPERIDRFCRRCHFEWSEAPLVKAQARP